MYSFGQDLLHLFDPAFQFLRYLIGIGPFQHHGDTANALACAVPCHGSKPFG